MTSNTGCAVYVTTDQKTPATLTAQGCVPAASKVAHHPGSPAGVTMLSSHTGSGLACAAEGALEGTACGCRGWVGKGVTAWFPGVICFTGSQLPSREDTQAAPWRGRGDQGLLPTASTARSAV